MEESIGQEHMRMRQVSWVLKMKIAYTSKLYFEKFCIKVIIKTDTPKKNRYTYDWSKPEELKVLSSWCQANFKEDTYKIKDRYIGQSPNVGTSFHQMVYLSDDDQKEQLIREFGKHIVEITQPYDSSHRDQLTIRNLIIVRSNLLFKKYQHAVYFKYDPRGEVWSWLQKYAEDEPDLKVDTISYWPRVYMVDDSHLSAFKLMWHERIDYIKTIQLLPDSDKDIIPNP